MDADAPYRLWMPMRVVRDLSTSPQRDVLAPYCIGKLELETIL
jgi:hypothetical protein